MEIKILAAAWGFQHVPLAAFLDRVRNAGYDGLDTWVPLDPSDKKLLFSYLQKHGMQVVMHQYRAQGDTFGEFKSSFLTNLEECAEAEPLLINSHTGHDWFTLDQCLELIDIAQNFSEKTGITVAHETHRGRMGYSPQSAKELFDLRENYLITADLSHWTCVTESMLRDFGPALDIAIKRTRHAHARVGYENGPQVADPRAPEWAYALEKFAGWWDRMVTFNHSLGRAVFTFTTEFGPPPYMPTIPYVNTPVADQFELNCFMKDFLRARYQAAAV